MTLTLDLPVWRRETLGLMRGVRMPLLMFGAAALALLVAFIFLIPWWSLFSAGAPVGRYSAASPRALTETGRALALALVMLEAVFVMAVTPGLCGGAFARERESSTFEALLLSPISTRGIVLQKWLGPVGVAALLLLCALPVVSMSVILGGISPGQLLWTQGLILATAGCMAAMGVFASSLFKRTNVAILIVYLAAGWWVLVQPGVVVLQGTMSMSYWSYDIAWLVFLTLCLVTVPLFSAIAYFVLRLLFRFVWKGQRSRAFYIIVFTALVVFFAVLNYMTATTIVHIDRLQFVSDLCSGNFPEYVLLGNPFGGLLHQLDAWEAVFGGWEYVPWTVATYVPIATGTQLLGMVVFLWLAIRRVARLRRPQA